MTSHETVGLSSFYDDVRATVLDVVSPLARPGSPLREIAGGPGKLLRGRLVHEAATASGRPFAWNDVVGMAAAVELLHLGSLIHDDVVDGADLRRGIDVAIGDSRATESRLLEGLACVHAAIDVVLRCSPDYGRVFASRLPALATGQILDAQRAGHLLATAELVDVHAGKTGSLMATAIELGLVAAQSASRRRMSLARSIGTSLGVCYQLIDDCRDMRGLDPLKSATDSTTGRVLFAACSSGGTSVEHAIVTAEGSLASARALWGVCFESAPDPSGVFGLIDAMLTDLKTVETKAS